MPQRILSHCVHPAGCTQLPRHAGRDIPELHGRCPVTSAVPEVRSPSRTSLPGPGRTSALCLPCLQLPGSPAASSAKVRTGPHCSEAPNLQKRCKSGNGTVTAPALRKQDTCLHRVDDIQLVFVADVFLTRSHKSVVLRAGSSDFWVVR